MSDLPHSKPRPFGPVNHSNHVDLIGLDRVNDAVVTLENLADSADSLYV